MPETDEERQKRWAAARAKNAARTPAMEHALQMSKLASQNQYKSSFTKNKGKGFTQVSSTPIMENVKRQTKLVSQNQYKSEFEKHKAKFTPVADDPLTLNAAKAMNQVSNIAYTGKGSAVSKSYVSTRAAKRLAELEGKYKKDKPKEVLQTVTSEKEGSSNNNTKEVSSLPAVKAEEPKLEEITVCPQPEPEIAICPQPEPEIAICPQPEPEVAICPQPEPEVAICPQPEVAICPQTEPEIAVCPQPELEVAICPQPEPEIAICPLQEPEIAENTSLETVTVEQELVECPLEESLKPKAENTEPVVEQLENNLELSEPVSKTKEEQLPEEQANSLDDFYASLG